MSEPTIAELRAIYAQGAGADEISADGFRALFDAGRAAEREECLAAVKAIQGRSITHDRALTKAENAIKARNG
ncbi:MAG: hypothetical protein WC718_16335 [Phycisphaerales bacterium]|jgi:hypothetical protein